MKDDYLDNANAHPIPKALFTELMDIAMEAVAGRRREIPPDVEREFQSGSLYLRDVPTNQMALSVRRQLRDKFPRPQADALMGSFLARWFALNRAKAAGRFGGYYAPLPEGGFQIHTALFDAASDCPIDGTGNFDPSYEERVDKIVAAEKDE